MRRLVLAAAVAAMSLSIAACDEKAPTTKERQSERALAAANSIDFSSNSEIENIQHRLKLTSDPGALGFIVLFNDAGSAILYTGVKGKVTSSGKRLTRPDESGCSAGDCSFRASASDEGTFGSSDPYVYFWDTNGTYHQWSGAYLYSDKPIRLRVAPLVITTEGAN